MALLPPVAEAWPALAVTLGRAPLSSGAGPAALGSELDQSEPEHCAAVARALGCGAGARV